MTVHDTADIVSALKAERLPSLLLRLCTRLIDEVNLHGRNEITYGKARLIVSAIIECTTFDEMSYQYDWDSSEEQFAYEQISEFETTAIENILAIATRRVKHQRKQERRAKTSLDDLKISLLITYCWEIPLEFDDFLQKKFASEFVNWQATQM
jgi:hypothetical protein